MYACAYVHSSSSSSFCISFSFSVFVLFLLIAKNGEALPSLYSKEATAYLANTHCATVSIRTCTWKWQSIYMLYACIIRMYARCAYIAHTRHTQRASRAHTHVVRASPKDMPPPAMPRVTEARRKLAPTFPPRLIRDTR